jgi:hypothetical protein
MDGAALVGDFVETLLCLFSRKILRGLAASSVNAVYVEVASLMKNSAECLLLRRKEKGSVLTPRPYHG